MVITPHRVIENGCVEVENGWITAVYKAAPGQHFSGKNTMDHGPGVILPSLVNAHLHLELSALKHRVPFDRGFAAWVQDLLKKREETTEAVLHRQAEKSARQLADQGIGYIGEISTLGLTRKIVQSLNLSGVWFREFLGSFQPKILIEKKEALSFSLAGHAPHTTDPVLLQAAKERTRTQNLPFSIHLSESDAESKFLSGQKGEWEKFLASRGIDTSLWPLGARSPVQYLDNLGILDSSTLAVHLLTSNDLDLDILARTGTQICLCPRSNLNLHGRLPEIGRMLKKKLAPALGSDSLASCDSLSIFDEMAFVRRNFPEIEPAQILSMATINGAKALGLAHLAGTLDKGKKSGFIYVDLTVGNNSDLIESLTTHET
ncbi:MAG: amidohydrolase family protein [Proteobacteria bacterium]|nr:amidohydrolase family protein [Pseudomonadota bacterium]MBU4129351.1 amidohydrolase family protein [Pseudomonadota bacterium]